MKRYLLLFSFFFVYNGLLAESPPQSLLTVYSKNPGLCAAWQNNFI